MKTYYKLYLNDKEVKESDNLSRLNKIIDRLLNTGYKKSIKVEMVCASIILNIK